ncbi:ABC transporter permease [Cohnella sp. WQ 127256]|uniref:ABC transporter permease n=1 Tax=Cohnella sp. WQ 127256 TaxID=2938790 RepID=UPI0021179D8A|nr:ABC transporter permease [Cohnella sp. WQ 127256]
MKEVTVKPSRNNRFRTIARPFAGFWLPALIVIVWQWLSYAGVLNRTLAPSPYRVAIEFWDLLISGTLLHHLRISTIRAMAGFGLGAAVGLVLGVAVGFLRPVEKSIDPSFQMLRTIPHLAITPLFVLWFGIGETSKVLLIALGAFFPLYINTFLGIRSADKKLFEVTRVLNFSIWKQITRLIIPSALPNILLGVRLSMGVSWLGLVVAEMMGSSAGIGFMINDARQYSQTTVVYVGILIFAVVGKLSDSLVRLLERHWLKWRDNFQG